jgi:hypothetical protein
MDEDKVVELDPSGRFERFAVCLGKGAYKEVYKAFDQEEGVEVAWNQLRVDNFNNRDVVQIASEIQILRSMRNDNIIVFQPTRTCFIRGCARWTARTRFASLRS